MAVKTHFLNMKTFMILFLTKKNTQISFMTDFMGFILLTRHFDSRGMKRPSVGLTGAETGNRKSACDPPEDRLGVMTQNVSGFLFATMSFPSFVVCRLLSFHFQRTDVVWGGCLLYCSVGCFYVY